MSRLNVAWLEELPEPVRIFIYRKAMQLIRDYVKDTATPFDDFAARIIGSFLAELLDVELPDADRVSDDETQGPTVP